MPETFRDPITLITAVAAFGLVLSVWMLGVLAWSIRRRKRTRQVRMRLDLGDPGDVEANRGRVLRLWHDGHEAVTVVPGEKRRKDLATRLAGHFADAGWETPLQTSLLGLSAVMGIVALGTYLITSSVIISILAVAAVALTFWIYLTQRIARRAAVFDQQLMDALELAARSLRVGHPLVGAFRLISEEIPAPVGKLFGEVCQQQALGVPMDRALREIADRATSEDLKLFATSVVIQLRSGGNLADMMERLAKVIRERNRLIRRVRVLTTQTQFSKRVLLALPFLMFVLLNVVNPAYMRPLYTTLTGELILLVACGGLMLGWVMMNWLSRLTP